MNYFVRPRGAKRYAVEFKTLRAAKKAAKTFSPFKHGYEISHVSKGRYKTICKKGYGKKRRGTSFIPTWKI